MTNRQTAKIEALFNNPVVQAVARKNAPPGMAEDAVSRAVLVAMEKMPQHLLDSDSDKAARWMVTVTKREAWALYRQQARFVDDSVLSNEDSQATFVERTESPAPGPYEVAVRSEAVERRMEALAQLFPDEKRALFLHEVGYSYQEIQDLTGWTYTKINRCMAEGRERLYQLLDADDLEPDRLTLNTVRVLQRRGVLAVA